MGRVYVELQHNNRPWWSFSQSINSSTDVLIHVIHGQFFNDVMMLYVVYMIMGEHTRNKVLLDALPCIAAGSQSKCV
jgi:hypothetical protein